MQNRATILLKWSAAAVIGVVILLGAAYLLTHRAEVGHELDLATTHKPEPITELYFAEPEQLPSAIPTAPTQLPVTFVIHNLETGPIDYTYRISFANASGQAITSADGNISLQDGQSQSITQVIALPAGQGRGAFSVQLLNKSQKIHYWLERL